MRTHTPAEMVVTLARLQRFAERTPWAGTGRRRTHGQERWLETPAGRIRVLVYQPGADAARPLVVDLHGGGFVFGHPELDDRHLPRLAEAVGATVVSVDYALAPAAPFPQALEECAAVVRYAQDHPGEFGIDPARVGLLGHSAGGNLAAAVCLPGGPRDPVAVQALVLDYPVLDLYTGGDNKPRGRGCVARTALHPRFSGAFDAAYCPDRAQRADPRVSPLFARRADIMGFPPTLILAAGHDSLRAEAAAFADHLADAGVDAAYYCFPDSGHGFTLRAHSPAAHQAWRLIDAHLARCLAPSATPSEFPGSSGQPAAGLSR
ncbi:MAG: alpha/beta hydrolase [Propionibacteriaceae bacterium]|nr:alpha/beta hydrolase [Propionibacteriaceae bacterium]